MVVRVGSVGSKTRSAELRIGSDKVFRKPVAPQHLALNSARNKGQVLVALERGVVIENVQRVGQSLVVPVGQIVPHALLSSSAQVHCASLQHSVERRPHWSKTSAGDIDAVEHSI